MDTIISDYLTDLKAAGRSPLTIMAYRQALRDLARYLEAHGVGRFEDVSARHLREYLVALQGARLKQSTIRTRAVTISCFFNWMVEQDLIPSNPMTRVCRPKKPQRQVNVFSTAELLRMFMAAEHSCDPARNRAILHVLLDCGLRVSELLAVKPSDYDSVASTLIVNGKGQKRRTVRMGHRCTEVFEAHLVTANGNLWGITREDLGDLIRRMGKRAGVRAWPHKFRHTFACRFLDAGGTIDELQYLLGHSDISTTMIYAAAGQEERALRSQVQHSPVDRLF